MKPNLLAGVVLLLLALCLEGCNPSDQPSGYTKEDLAKRPAPAGYGPPQTHAGGPPPSSTAPRQNH
jgi:hypothetical protein